MTDEDKKIVADYMGWKMSEWMIIDGSAHVVNPHFFDPNDAALCVAEMQKRGNWEQFHDFVIEWGDLLSKASFAYITAWLMSMEEGQAKNFFKAFVEWRKGK